MSYGEDVREYNEKLGDVLVEGMDFDTNPDIDELAYQDETIDELEGEINDLQDTLDSVPYGEKSKIKELEEEIKEKEEEIKERKEEIAENVSDINYRFDDVLSEGDNLYHTSRKLGEYLESEGYAKGGLLYFAKSGDNVWHISFYLRNGELNGKTYSDEGEYVPDNDEHYILDYLRKNVFAPSLKYEIVGSWARIYSQQSVNRIIRKLRLSGFKRDRESVNNKEFFSYEKETEFGDLSVVFMQREVYAKGGEVDGQNFRSAVIFAKDDIEENDYTYIQDINLMEGLQDPVNRLYKASQKLGIYDEDTWQEAYEVAFEELGMPDAYAKGGMVKKSDFTMLGAGLLIGGLFAFLKK